MSEKQKRTVVIVGAGMSGLTAGAYLLRGGHDVVILEKTSDVGGLVHAFRERGFLFDTGPRAVANAGILIPMLEDLGIELPLIKGEVSMGIEDHIVHFDSHENIDDYIRSLHSLFPEAGGEIGRIERRIRSHTRMARVLNKVANPFFRNPRKDPRYLFFELLPWLPSFLAVVVRTGLSHRSIEDALSSFSGHPSLNDMVSQYFFKGTPANFAFGYFESFQDYRYPPGGTATIPKALARKVRSDGGDIRTNTEVVEIDPVGKTLVDRNGRRYAYDLMLWTADLKALYRRVDDGRLAPRIRAAVRHEREKYLSARSGESVFSIFLAVDEPPETFRKISRGHFIYTPSRKGLGEIHRERLDRIKTDFDGITKPELFRWLEDFCLYNSYEISIPVLKDRSLAPEGTTGLIISLLFDGELLRLVEKAGWYEEWKEKTTEHMLEVLQRSVYPDINGKILFQKTATPMTLMKRFDNENGAITGWSLEEEPPVPRSLTGIGASVETAIPYLYKSGQWSYSPSGVPIAILTGRFAAKTISRDARKL